MRDVDFIIGNNRTRTVVNGSPTSVTVFVGDAEATLGRGGELTACGDEILALRGPATVAPHKRALA